jgi:DMSO reductase anchor subunit
MHPIWRVSLGVVVAVLRFASPGHGFWPVMARYHQYSNIPAWENAMTVCLYLVCALLIGSGLYRFVFAKRAPEHAAR